MTKAMTIQQYDEYKECDCGWNKVIPLSWTTIALKHTAREDNLSFIDGDWIESGDITTEGIRYLTTGNVGVLHYKEQGTGYITEESFEKLGCTEVFPNDILISRLNEPIGRSCIVPDLGCRIVVAVDNVIYRPNTALYDKQFLVYQMNCKPYSENANVIARGSTMSRISRTMLGAIKICVPPLAEQEAIVRYLDERCREIDGRIELEGRRIELLTELKQSIITQAVTEGLDPNAPKRDSGVQWLGQIPQHWEVRKLKFVIHKIKSGGTPTSDNTDFYAEDGIPWVTIADMSNVEIVKETASRITEQGMLSKNLELHPQGTLLYSIYATIGKVALLGVPATTNQAILALYVKPQTIGNSYLRAVLTALEPIVLV